MVTKTQKRAGIGIAAAAAAAAAAAGAYWFYGAKDAPRHRRAVRSWMLRARAEVLEAMEKLGDIDKETYLRIVDEVLKRYANTAGVTSAELAQAARDLKSTWQKMQTAGRQTKRPARRAKKAAPRGKKKSS